VRGWPCQASRWSLVAARGGCWAPLPVWLASVGALVPDLLARENVGVRDALADRPSVGARAG